jgi:hypothetical protein
LIFWYVEEDVDMEYVGLDIAKNYVLEVLLFPEDDPS